MADGGQWPILPQGGPEQSAPTRGSCWPFAALLLAEVLLQFGLAAGIWGLASFAALHGGASLAATALWLLGARDSPAADRFARGALALLFSLLGGPFGAAIALALVLRPAQAATCVATTERPMPPVEVLHHALLDRRLRLTSAHRSPALLDVMLTGGVEEKFAALRLINRHFVPSMVAALRCAINDADASVRVLAATVTAKLHHRNIRRIQVCQAAVEESPLAAPAWQRLATAYADYAESGLLEPLRADVQRASEEQCRMKAEELAAAAPDGLRHAS